MLDKVYTTEKNWLYHIHPSYISLL